MMLNHIPIKLLTGKSKLLPVFFIIKIVGYSRIVARDYALKYALGRNKNFYDFSRIGGDCTNFVSQCIFAGTGKMDYSKDGWFYVNLDKRTPSWTGVEELASYLLHNNHVVVKAKEIAMEDIQTGDVIQLKRDGRFYHSLFVTKVDYPVLSMADIFVSCHSADRLNARLNSFMFEQAKFLKVY